ncbi:MULTISPECIES: IclR family transcriptional regulator [unclassified Pigmentiphaga]|uniref:IclR family transcriptional regulator n=1 Tax=unclassified Pigmentiphaga TaxID=2626614 RepID=UPI000B40DCA9|nr:MULTISPECIES: IclR family transcriptional regulator [unclassified Pigmentiphaga]OVZ65179.1 hypothetical protein CDO46_07225 [Pigmentiphaga sp. NML030171]
MKNSPSSPRHSSSGIQERSRDTVHAVTRALAVLDTFQVDEQPVSLSELSRRLAMGKTTVLRTARTLALAGYLTQTEDGRWRLGPAAGWLGVRYQTSFDVDNVIDVLLRRLHGVTSETAAFFVREGNWRTCVARVDRHTMTRVHLRVGEKLPLDKGASGRVLLAFSGQRGELYDRIRRSGFYISTGERDPTMSSIAIPVFRASRELFGALCVSGQTDRLNHETLTRHLKPLINAGAELSRSLSAHGKAPAS